MSDQQFQQTPSPQEPAFNEAKFAEAINQRLAEMHAEQNLVKGILFGTAAAVIGALAWAALTVMTGMQIGYAAIGLGFLVGLAVKMGGKGLTPTYGIIGAILAVISCVFGNYLSAVGLISSEASVSYMEAMKIFPAGVGIPLIMENLEPMDFLFFGLAGYFGYKCAINSLDEDELAAIHHQSQ